jgi:hypothetical protein
MKQQTLAFSLCEFSLKNTKDKTAFFLPSMFPIGGVQEVQLKRELEAGEEVVQGPGGVVVHVCV